MIKEKEQIDELEAYKGKWTNLHFSIHGSSELGLIYNSEAEAKAVIDYDLTLPPVTFYTFASGAEWLYEDLSHTIQIPIKE